MAGRPCAHLPSTPRGSSSICGSPRALTHVHSLGLTPPHLPASPGSVSSSHLSPPPTRLQVPGSKAPRECWALECGGARRASNIRRRGALPTSEKVDTVTKPSRSVSSLSLRLRGADATAERQRQAPGDLSSAVHPSPTRLPSRCAPPRSPRAPPAAWGGCLSSLERGLQGVQWVGPRRCSLPGCPFAESGR